MIQHDNTRLCFGQRFSIVIGGERDVFQWGMPGYGGFSDFFYEKLLKSGENADILV